MGDRDTRAGPADAAPADRLLASLQRKKRELDGQLAELRERRQVLLAYLESNGYQHSESTVWPADRVRKLDSREGELAQCLALLKLRCQLMAEELTEITLLAEALYALSSASTTAPLPAPSAVLPTSSSAQPPAMPPASSSAQPPVTLPAPYTAPPAESSTAPSAAPSAGSAAASSATPSAAPPAVPSASPSAPPLAIPSGTPPAVPAAGPSAVPPTDALARLLSNPQVQKMATQMLAQFLKN